MRKKLYLIALKNHGFEILIMLNIKITTKLGGITHQIKLEDGFGGKKKIRLKSMT